MSTLGLDNPLRALHEAVAGGMTTSSIFLRVFGDGNRFRYRYFEEVADLASLQPGDLPFVYIVLSGADVNGHGTSSSTLITLTYRIIVAAADYGSLLDALWAVSAAVTSFQTRTGVLTLNLAFQIETQRGDLKFDASVLKVAECTLDISASVGNNYVEDR